VVLGSWSDSRLRNGLVGGITGGVVAFLVIWLNNVLAFSSMATMVNPDLLVLPLSYHVYLTLLAALFVGAISGIGVGSLGTIDLVEALNWSWRRFWKMATYAFIPGITIGLLIWGVARLVSPGGFTWEQFWELLGRSLLLGIICALTSGVAGGFIPKVMTEKASPNQGIKLSTRSFIVVLFISWFILGLVVWLTPVGEAFFLPQTLFSGIALGLSLALSTALSLGG